MKPLRFENDLSVNQNIIKGMIKLLNAFSQQLHGNSYTISSQKWLPNGILNIKWSGITLNYRESICVEVSADLQLGSWVLNLGSGSKIVFL